MATKALFIVLTDLCKRTLKFDLPTDKRLRIPSYRKQQFKKSYNNSFFQSPFGFSQAVRHTQKTGGTDSAVRKIHSKLKNPATQLEAAPVKVVRRDYACDYDFLNSFNKWRLQDAI